MFFCKNIHKYIYDQQLICLIMVSLISDQNLIYSYCFFLQKLAVAMTIVDYYIYIMTIHSSLPSSNLPSYYLDFFFIEYLKLYSVMVQTRIIEH